MTVASETTAQPTRHILAMPEECGCGMCAPAWMRRRGKSSRYSEPVSLLEALEREQAAARPELVAQHLELLTSMGSAAAETINADAGGMFGAPEVGLPVLLFASELAAAIQPGTFRDELPDSMVRECDQVIGAVTIVAAESLGGLADVLRAASAIAS
jgi:hypothetical protein